MSENLEKRIRSRSIQKHDLEVNWNKATSFVPYKGEFIIYDIEVDADGNNITQTVDGVEKTVYELVGRTTPYTYERIKLGDGKTRVYELPFIDNTSLKYIEQELTEAQKAQARANIDAVSTTELETGLSGKLTIPEDPRNLSGEDPVYFGENNIASVTTIAGMEYGANGGFETNLVISSDPAQTWQGPGLTEEKNYSETIVVARAGRSGQIKVPLTPSADNDATSKKYVAGQVATKTSVTVGGVHQETFDADTKVSKLGATGSGAYRAYIAKPDGTVQGFNVQTSVNTSASECIPRFVTSTFPPDDSTIVTGYLTTNTPKRNTHAANKKYVDDTVTAMGDTKMNALQNSSNSYIIPAIPFNSNQPVIRILTTAVSDIYSGRIPYYFGSTSDHPVPANGWLITATPNYEGDCTNKKYVDDNFIAKTAESQTITGNLAITGKLQVQGTTETVDAVTYKIENNVIEFNPNKIYNETWLTGLAINKGLDGETDLGTYGIMYDPSTDAVKLGFGQVDEENKFRFNENESAPIATREEFNDSWEDDAIFVFDKTTKSFKYSGKTFASFEEEITAKILTTMRSEMNTFVKDYVENYMSYTEIEHEDGTIETISDILFAENYTEKQNGTELWVEEN